MISHIRRSALAKTLPLISAATLLGHAAPALALNEDLQCVPYARQVSGVQIYGDAHTWWSQSQGKYEHGSQPRIGAVLAFKPHGRMQLGHVAAVSKIIDDRTILVRHANWSTIDGKRGHVEDDVKVVDVSDNNDWSKVRVWYTPIGALGGTQWPTHGFIYNDKPSGPVRYAANKPSQIAQKPTPVIAAARAPNPARMSALRDNEIKNQARSEQANAPAALVPVQYQAPFQASFQTKYQPQNAYQVPALQEPVYRPAPARAIAAQPLQNQRAPRSNSQIAGYTPASSGVRSGPATMNDLLNQVNR